MKPARFCALALLTAAVVTLTARAVEPTVGNPGIKSIEAIAFGPDGLLLIGDGRGAQVVSIETGDLAAVKWTKTDIADIRAHLAGKLGADAKGIEILKLAVNPVSQKVYIAVRRLQDKQDVLLTLDGAGKVSEFSFDKVKHNCFPLSAGEKSKITKVTDLTWADDRILVAAQANETFASRIFSILPKGAEAVCFSTDTFHVAHNQWETKAPIRTVIPYEQGGKRYLVGAFTCTPIVKYALDDMKPNAQVKGESVIELGYGNTPQDMFIYEKDGKSYILMNTVRMKGFQAKDPVGPSPYWTCKVDYNILAETAKINDKALQRTAGKASESKTDRAVVVPTFHGVMHMDRLDTTRAVVIRTDDKDGMSLAVLALP
jgi:hypothetical protein